MSVTLDKLRIAVAKLRDSGFVVEADDFDSILTAAWTTSSELLGEIGLRIVRITRAHRHELPLDAQATFESMLREVEQTWFGIRNAP